MLFLLSSGALAHSQKLKTVPADGAILSEPPEVIEMVFDDPMRITFIRLVNSDGEELPLERETGLDASIDFRAFPDNLPPGQYRFEWRGLASDGHAMQGGFSFELAD